MFHFCELKNIGLCYYDELKTNTCMATKQHIALLFSVTLLEQSDMINIDASCMCVASRNAVPFTVFPLFSHDYNIFYIIIPQEMKMLTSQDVLQNGPLHYWCLSVVIKITMTKEK